MLRRERRRVPAPVGCLLRRGLAPSVPCPRAVSAVAGALDWSAHPTLAAERNPARRTAAPRFRARGRPRRRVSAEPATGARTTAGAATAPPRGLAGRVRSRTRRTGTHTYGRTAGCRRAAAAGALASPSRRSLRPGPDLTVKRASRRVPQCARSRQRFAGLSSVRRHREERGAVLGDVSQPLRAFDELAVVAAFRFGGMLVVAAFRAGLLRLGVRPRTRGGVRNLAIVFSRWRICATVVCRFPAIAVVRGSGWRICATLYVSVNGPTADPLNLRGLSYRQTFSAFVLRRGQLL